MQLTAFHHQVLEHLNHVVHITTLAISGSDDDLNAEFGVEPVECATCKGYGEVPCGCCDAEKECPDCGGEGSVGSRLSDDKVLRHLQTMAHDARDRIKLTGEL